MCLMLKCRLVRAVPACTHKVKSGNSRAIDARFFILYVYAFWAVTKFDVINSNVLRKEHNLLNLVT